MITEQLTRSAFAWMMLALAATLVPHLRHLPIWSIGVVLAIFIWRIQIHRGLWRAPGRIVKFSLALASIAALQLHYGVLLRLEPMVGLLLLSMMLKLLEMHRPRDAMTVILLAFFTTATQFLFSQTVLDFLFGLLCFVLLVTTLIAVNQKYNPISVKTSLPLALRLTAQCLPVMLVLFVFFPRIGSLWTVPLPQDNAVTGVSDSMSPGDIASLSRDGGRAFTVSFEGSVPPKRDLYWRGIVMSYFDGRTWSPSRWGGYPEGTLVDWNITGTAPQSWRSEAVGLGREVNYQIILEPTQQLWLFALPLADSKDSGLGLSRDFTLIKQGVVSQRFKYDVTSQLDYRLDAAELSSWMRARALQLPDDFNPETRAVAELWLAEEESAQALIDRFLAMIAADFRYTLDAPLLGTHSVDDFLWQTRAGFCEHFASAFVVFMRAAGIPARVVAGYQGGEWIESFLQVSQADAHAWAEVWLPEQGWVRIDPTAAVAPERVESGIQTVFSRTVSNPLSMEAYRHISLLNSLRLRLDVWNYNWQRWVLNYDQDQQLSLLTRLLGTISWWSAGLLLVSSVGLVLAIIWLMSWWSNRLPPSAPEVRAFKRLARKGRRLGVEIRPGESARSYIGRLIAVVPEQEKQLQRILSLFEQAHYQSRRVVIGQLKNAVAEFCARG